MPPACRVCGRQLQPLDDDRSRWYCYKDDQLWLDKEQKWTGRLLVEEEPQEEGDHTYEALYIGGYRNVKSSSALVSVLSDSIKTQITELEWEATGPGLKGSFRKVIVSTKDLFEIPYASLQLVNITNEREITALRTFLIGSVFAAMFKKENRILSLGFLDAETGLMQTPYFKIAHGDIRKCYGTIINRLRRVKGLQSRKTQPRSRP